MRDLCQCAIFLYFEKIGTKIVFITGPVDRNQPKMFMSESRFCENQHIVLT